MSLIYPVYRRRGPNYIPGSIFTAFDHFFNDTKHLPNGESNTPKANIYSKREGYAIELAAPGFSRDDFEMHVDNHVLSIKVSCSDGPQEEELIKVREYRYTSFERSFTLPKEIHADGITARYEAGILKVNIPVEHEVSKRRTISVE